MNKGDGTWSKDLNAPNVTGMYHLLLEIGQNGLKTFIDSSDSRYSFYLEVIEEIGREVDLIKYLPDFFEEILEFNVLFDTENIELDIFYNQIKKIKLDVFVRTASMEKVSRLESFLRFKGERTLDQRRTYLLALLQKGKKLNEGIIKEVTNTITGSDCIVTFFGADELKNPQPSFALLQVQVLSPDNNKEYRYADIGRTLKSLVPANIKLLVVRYFASWNDVNENFQDWNAVKATDSWQAVKNYIPPQ